MARQLKKHVAKLFLPMQASGRLLATRHAHDRRTPLFADNLHENPLTTTSVELAIKNSLPRTEIEFSFRECDDDFSSHYLSLQMSITVVFACVVMPIHRLLWSEPFQEIVVVLQQAGLIVIDVYAGRNMHCVHQDEAFPYPTRFYHCLDVGRDIDVGAPGLCLEPEFFAVGLHDR